MFSSYCGVQKANSSTGFGSPKEDGVCSVLFGLVNSVASGLRNSYVRERSAIRPDLYAIQPLPLVSFIRPSLRAVNACARVEDGRHG